MKSPLPTNTKKKAPNWMDCNCMCHGDWGNPDTDSIGKTCPHCKPEMYPNYEI